MPEVAWLLSARCAGRAGRAAVLAPAVIGPSPESRYQ